MPIDPLLQMRLVRVEAQFSGLPWSRSAVLPVTMGSHEQINLHFEMIRANPSASFSAEAAGAFEISQLLFDGARARQLRANEVSGLPWRSDLPIVIEPEASLSIEAWIETVERNAGRVRNALRTFGAVLLRAPCLTLPEQFKAITAALGLSGSDYPYFTDNYRKRLSPGVVNASSTHPSYPVPPHTEQAFSQVRPGIVAFVCLEPPLLGGETPLHDCVATYAALEPSVRAVLDSSWFCKETRQMSAKALVSNFNTQERDVIERICARFRVRFSWANGKLSIAMKGPCVVVHPSTGERAFSCFWTATSLYYFFRRFRDAPGVNRVPVGIAQWVPLRLVVWALRHSHPFFRKDYVYSIETNGIRCRLPISLELHLNEVIWAHTTIFHWLRGDVLLIDNIKIAHSRLPFLPPRRVGASVFDYYDAMTLKAHEPPT